jgi:hypothetical protein
MTVSELKAALDRLRIPSSAFSIGSDVNEAYCMVLIHGRWHVYYSERGNRNNERVHGTEQAACEDLFSRVTKDGAVLNWMHEHST